MRRLASLLLVFAAACTQTGADAGTPAAPVRTTTLPGTTTPTTRPVAPATTSPPATTTTPPATTTTMIAPLPETPQFFVFMPGGLPSDFSTLARSIPGVESVSLSVSGTLHIVETRTAAGVIVDRPPDGFFIPVEARLLDGPVARGFPEDRPGGLRPGEVVLGATSAEIRRLVPGDTITFEGGAGHTVTAVVPDDAVGSAEVVVVDTPAFDGARTRARSARVIYRGSGEELEAALLAALGDGDPLRVGEVGAGSGRRPGGLVRSQAAIKQMFGEFAYRPGSGIGFTIDPAWVAQNIVHADIPLLGSGPCHRKFAEMLTGIMQSLVDAGLSDVIDRRAFRGCYVPRFIGGSTRISRHAYGAAADINWGNTPDDGPGSPVHPELLARMEEMGMTSGHLFTNIDPGHFEWYGPGAPELLATPPP